MKVPSVGDHGYERPIADGISIWEAIMLSETTIAALKSELRGEVIEPGDAGYDAARKVYNAMIDRKPRLIVRCADVADVTAALKFSRDHKLPISVRGGVTMRLARGFAMMVSSSTSHR